MTSHPSLDHTRTPANAFSDLNACRQAVGKINNVGYYADHPIAFLQRLESVNRDVERVCIECREPFIEKQRIQLECMAVLSGRRRSCSRRL